ncbi:hypothetical protein ARMGADRAFT_1025249 [Armillaria gallica]|uniref:Uncharacterized protein n=1 Tax=Armillaria gallica TaxID=47427 RepID=A0A2H3DUK0_ARMGA|nr:hypothetical protein ARMGADRAFT_1025249 [Armillaria gallica]
MWHPWMQGANFWEKRLVSACIHNTHEGEDVALLRRALAKAQPRPPPYTSSVQGISCEARSCGKNKFRCIGPECTWSANTKSVFTRHLKRFHANVTSSSSMVKNTTEPISHSATSSTQESRTEVLTKKSLQQPNTVRPPATLSHDAPVTSPDHYFVTPSTFPQTTYEWIMEAGGSAIEPQSSWYPYPTLPPSTVSSTISTLSSVAPDYYVDTPSSSSNTLSYSFNAYPDGIQARSPSIHPPVGTTRNDEDLLRAPSLRFINFQQSNPYPHYAQVAEQQNLATNPVLFPDSSFGTVPPQVDGGEIMSPSHNFWGEAPYSSGAYHLGSSTDPVTDNNASSVPDSATNSQFFGYQYAPHNVPPQATVNGSFVAGDQAVWDGASTNAGAYWNAGNM